MNARHGVFAPTSRLRDKVVPRPASTSDGAEPPVEPQVSKTSPPRSSPKSTSVPSTYRLDWAALLKGVFGVDVLKCSRCQGQMRLIACIESEGEGEYPCNDPAWECDPAVIGSENCTSDCKLTSKRLRELCELMCEREPDPNVDDDSCIAGCSEAHPF